jgi:lipopolysaccharide export system permease protein
MIKIYQNYLIKLFLSKILKTSLVFSLLVFILNVFEEINFFKNINVEFFFPFFLTVLALPSTLFIIFPFIFLISVQFLFIDLINKDELSIFKTHGLNNLKIIKILLFSSFIFGLFISYVFYGFSSKLNFIYLDLKNQYSSDNKYLATTTENGLWIKDEINNKIYITNAKTIANNYLQDVSIVEFDKNFKLIRTINSEKVNIISTKWVILKPKISINNNVNQLNNDITLITHFDANKINTFFKNLSSIGLFQIKNLIKEYSEMGYSTDEIENHFYNVILYPVYLSLMTIFSSIIMLNIKRSKPIIFHIILGIMLSVVIYYVNYLFSLLGISGRIPTLLSVLFPLFVLLIINIIGLIRINEK